MLGINAMIQEGHVTPIVGKVFPFDKACDAHQYIQDRKNLGKVLLDFTLERTI